MNMLLFLVFLLLSFVRVLLLLLIQPVIWIMDDLNHLCDQVLCQMKKCDERSK